MFHIIDDEINLCNLTKALLRSIGLKSITFTDPMAYCRYMSSESYEKPTAVFTDIEMPGMNGYELIDKIMEHHPNSKIIIISGFYNQTNMNRYPGLKFIAKPYKIEELIKISKELAQSHS